MNATFRTLVTLLAASAAGQSWADALLVNQGPLARGVQIHDEATGAFVRTLTSDFAFDPTKAALGSDGQLYVTYTQGPGGFGGVRSFDALTGQFLRDVVPLGGSGLMHPLCLAFGPDGNLYVGNAPNYRVPGWAKVFNPSTGAFVRDFAASGDCRYPTAMAFGPDGAFYLCGVRAEPTNGGVMRYDGSSGTFLGDLIPQQTTFGYRDFAFRADGSLIVAGVDPSYVAGVVREFDGLTGAYLRDLVGPSTLLEEPWALTVGPNGNVFCFTEDWASGVGEFDGVTGAFLRQFFAPQAGPPWSNGRGIHFVPQRSVQPESYRVARGRRTGGGLPELGSSDDGALTVDNRSPVANQSEAPINVEFGATAPFASPVGMSLTIESRVSASNLSQSLELFDWQGGAWVVQDLRAGSLSDQTVTVRVADPARYLRTGTREMLARVLVRRVGPVPQSTWAAHVDLVSWRLDP